MDIRGKNAIVTGAATGIGRATAMMFGERGVDKIVVADVNERHLGTLAQELRAVGATVIPKIVDVSKTQNVIQMYHEAEAETGGLDIMFNNAGIMTGEPDFPDTIMEKMIAVIDINLTAMMVGTRVGVDLLRKRKAPGVIVNTSSIAAFGPVAVDPAYAASKHGILAFSQSCKPLHEAFNIRVMAICPGVTDTALWPKQAPWAQAAMQQREFLQPSEIAKAVCDIVEDDTLSGEYVIVHNTPREQPAG